MAINFPASPSTDETYTENSITWVFNGTAWNALGEPTTASDLGLGNVDNTSDASKPVSTAQASADAVVLAAAVQRANHTGTQTLATISDAGTAAASATGDFAPIAHASDTANPHTVTATQVGLGSADNTADAAKPVSTAQQTALDLKQDTLAGGASLIPVSAPTGFGFTDYGFNIWYNTGSSTFSHDFSIESYKFTPDNTYYVATDGDDSDDGSALTPFATLQKAVDTSKAASDTSATINISSGVYYNGEVMTSQIDSADPNFNIVCPDTGAALLTTATRGTFVLESGDCYVLTVTGFVGHGTVDLDEVDDFGFYKKLERVFTLTECINTPGTDYRATNKIYVHKFNSGVPTDQNTLALDTSNGFTFAGLGLYLSNIHLYGGPASFSVNMGFATSPVAFDRVLFHSSWNLGGGLTVTNLGAGDKVVSYRSSAVYNAYDGLNYHGSGGDIIEVECFTSSNGDLEAGNSDNGTTVHDGISALRVNPVSVNEKNRAIHDIGAGHSWIIGGVVDGVRDTAPDLDSVAYYCGLNGGDTTEMWLDTCTSRGGCATDFAVSDGCTLLVRNCNISPYSRIDTDTTGSIDGY